MLFEVILIILIITIAVIIIMIIYGCTKAENCSISFRFAVGSEVHGKMYAVYYTHSVYIIDISEYHRHAV